MIRALPDPCRPGRGPRTHGATRRALSALAVLSCLAPSAAGAAPDNVRGTLAVRGRVVNQEGAPLVNAWVYTQGSRRVSTLTGDDGGYVLAIPGGTLRELARAPLLLRVQARAKGWRLVRGDGSPELGIELRVLADPDGMARLRVRSNDPRIATALADAAVLEGSPVMVLEVDFRATPEPAGSSGPAALSATEEVTLSGVSLPGPTAATTAPPLPPGPAVIPTGERASEKMAGPPPEPRTGKVADTPAAPSIEGDDTESPTATSKSPRRERAERAQELAKQREQEKAREREEKEKEREQKAKERELEKEMQRALKAKAKEERDKEKPAPVRPYVYNPADAPAGGEVARSERVVNPAAPAAGGVSPAPVVVRPAGGADRPPEVVRPAQPADGGPAGDWCTCRVDGLLEIRSEQRLPERVTVRVYVERHRDVSDEVEIFMGSPRSFTLRAVPCGPQRVMFDARSKLRFTLASPAPVIDCTDGGTRQVRLVLEPAKRKSKDR